MKAHALPRVLLAPIVLVGLGCGASDAGDDVPFDRSGYVAGYDPIVDDAHASDAPAAPEVGAARPVAYEGDAPPADVSVPVDTATAVDTSVPVDSGGVTCTDTTLDVDGVAANGCEVTDPLANRSEASPTKLGVLGACTAYSTQSFSLVSDARLHTPSGVLGAAPLYWSFYEDASCALGEKPTLGSFSVAGGAPGTYEIVIYPQGGAPDPKCTGKVTAGGSIGPITCSAPFTSRGFVRVQKLDGGAGTASITFKVR